MDPWYKHRVCNNANNNINSVNKNNLLSWQLINSSCTRVNKPFVPTNNAELKTIGHSLTETRWHETTTRCYIMENSYKIGGYWVAFTFKR